MAIIGDQQLLDLGNSAGSIQDRLLAAVFDFNYLRMWYSAESDGTAPFRVPDKMIYGSPATVNADSWATGADFT
jgi:hypothetical protein